MFLGEKVMKKSQKWLVYIFFVVVFVFANLGADLIDIHFNEYHILSLIVKFVSFGILGFYVIKTRTKIANSYRMGYTFMVLIPLIFSFALFMGWPNQKEYFMVIIFEVVNLILMVVTEELFFRAFAVNLFEYKSDIKFSDTFALTTIYALSFAVNFFLYDYKFALFSMIFAFAFGLFLLGLYLRTKNVYVCILSHLAYSGVRWFFKTFSSYNMMIGNILFLVIASIFFAILIVLGIVMCKKGTSGSQNKLQLKL